MIDLTPEQWALGLIGAFLIGLSKGGIPGIGNLTAGIYATIFPAKASVGILLPVLICGDIVAVLVYRRHALWPYIAKLAPWTAIGVIIGWLLFGAVSDRQIQVIIGVILVGMTVVHFWRIRYLQKGGESQESDFVHSLPFAIAAGILVGFSTMMANAAGPVAALYLMAMGLPKYAFIGTSAWFFFLVNLFKIPFMIEQEVITGTSIWLSLSLGVMAILGGLAAPKMVKHINQKWFGGLVWFFIVVAGVGLLIKPDWPRLLLSLFV